jgi:hypothetical protein
VILPIHYSTWRRRIYCAAVNPCKTFRGACHLTSLIERSKQGKMRETNSKQVTNKNKRCTNYYPILSYVRNMLQKEYSRPRPGPARKHRVLHNQYLIRPVRLEIAGASNQPLTLDDPQPQYSLSLSFLPISRLLALTVALSEGFVAPSSRASPLAFNAWRSMPASKKPSVS